ncbi:MAG: CRISPR-associated protein Csx20, partial [Desulfomonilaceae bacterium]|nr:CRISPR-associated protein Csx20 [Desulfomonilaceae bacterium]
TEESGHPGFGSVPASLPGDVHKPRSTGTEAGATGRTLFLVFNHTITERQRADARSSLGVDRIVTLPPELQELWSNIPPEAPEIRPVLEPLRRWLHREAQFGDFVLIQGDFGACYLMVMAAREMGLVPVYSTTRRQASEEVQSDGSVKLVHRFEHVLFREYGG